ncbi:DUF6233 domain-containing protein [Streptomyces violaceus]|uniref:DUF6233 domain-containing protein n=1 Tax=Streptomyces violaceus TaxID=1936 RepID=A0ABY9UPJ1_STRVL|nr:DUF6233 domain-containing protein [Streptomyces janthinus]WND23700.1 DUF6233 domain-containing protein [Streptomyces janthinus]
MPLPAYRPHSRICLRIHTDDCAHGGVKNPISADDARAALIDAQMKARRFCCPDDVLGIDLE